MMKINLDSLKCVKKLQERGMEATQGEAFVTTLMETEFDNIYSVREIDIMLSETVKDVFREQARLREESAREFDKKMKEQAIAREKRDRERKAAFEEQLKAYKRQAERQERQAERRAERQTERQERQFDRQIAEMRADRRWVIGTIITVGLALAGYLSALIHFTHH